MDELWTIEIVANTTWTPDEDILQNNGRTGGVFTSLDVLQKSLAKFVDVTGSAMVDNWAEVNPGANEYWYCRYNESDSNPPRIITVFAEKYTLNKLDTLADQRLKRFKRG